MQVDDDTTRRQLDEQAAANGTVSVYPGGAAAAAADTGTPTDVRHPLAAPVLVHDPALDAPAADAPTDGSDTLHERTLFALCREFRRRDPHAVLPVVHELNARRRTYVVLNKLAGWVLDTRHEHTPVPQELDPHPLETHTFLFSALFRAPHDAPAAHLWRWQAYESPPHFDKLSLHTVESRLIDDDGGGQAATMQEDTAEAPPPPPRAEEEALLHRSLLRMCAASGGLLQGCEGRFVVAPPPSVQLVAFYFQENDAALRDGALLHQRTAILQQLQQQRADLRRAPPADAAVATDTLGAECELMSPTNRTSMRAMLAAAHSGAQVDVFERYLGGERWNPAARCWEPYAPLHPQTAQQMWHRLPPDGAPDMLARERAREHQSREYEQEASTSGKRGRGRTGAAVGRDDCME